MTQVNLALNLVLLALTAGNATADPAIVNAVDADQSGNTWRFDVTLSHGDTGWDDYADGWRIVTADGQILGTRELLHPHVTEQPFTRSLAGVAIPNGIDFVFVEARTNAEGWGPGRFRVDLPAN